jgi:hypothetical protein
MTDANSNDKRSEPEHPTVIDLEADEVRAEAPPSPSPRPPRRSRSRLYGAVALAAVAALAGAWLYRDYAAQWWPTPRTQMLEARIAALETVSKSLNDQAASLGTEIASLRGSLAEAAKSATTANEAKSGLADLATRLGKAETAVNELRKAIDDLHRSMARTPATTAPAPDAARVTALEARVAEIEKTMAALKTGPGPDAQTATLLSQSLADLKAKLAAGAPYKDEFDRLAALVPAAPGLDVLANHAAAGIANAAGLAKELEAIAAALPGPEQPPPRTEQGYWDSFTDMLGSLVIIRRIGETDWRAAAAKAQGLAAAGDLQAAIASLDAIESEKPAAIADWLNRARARLAVDTAAEDVSAAVLRQIAAIGGKP